MKKINPDYIQRTRRIFAKFVIMPKPGFISFLSIEIFHINCRSCTVSNSVSVFDFLLLNLKVLDVSCGLFYWNMLDR